MSRRTISQVSDFIKLSLVIPLVERIADGVRMVSDTMFRVFQALFVAPIRSVNNSLRSILTSRREAAVADTTTLHDGGQRSEYVEYYAEPEAFPMEEAEPASNPAQRRPLFTRLRAGAADAAAALRQFAISAGAAMRNGLAGLRSVLRAGGATLIAKLRTPRQTAREIAIGLRAGAEKARHGIASLRRADATVAGLFILALLGPLAAPNLSDEATIALTRHNPLVERVSVTAEQGLALSTPSTPTLWTGVTHAVGERDIAPDWVLNAGVDLGPLSPAEALMRPARVVEITPAPIWSPALASLGVEDDESDYEPIETASIPFTQSSVTIRPMNKREVAKLELGAFDTGPTASTDVAATRPSVGEDGLAAGDYDTASVNAPAPTPAWPGMEAGDAAATLPSSIAQALNLGDGSKQSLPLKSARPPSMRPVLVGAKRTPRLTVVLTAVGINERASRAAVERLPSAVALAIAPVAKNPSAWVDAAHATGRTALLEIPMEPVTYPRVNPGPLTLLANQDADENLKRLQTALAKAPEVDGVASYLGSRFSSVRGAVAPVLADLKKRDLFLLETDPGPLSHLLRTAAEIDMPATSSLVSLDKSARTKDLSEGFARLEEAAKVKGHAIGVAVAVPSTVEALEKWTRELEKRGFRLAALPL